MSGTRSRRLGLCLLVALGITASGLPVLAPAQDRAIAPPNRPPGPEVIASPVQRALYEALQRDDAPAVTTALLRGADPNQPDPVLGPALLFAARERGYRALEALLLLPSVDVDVTTAQGETALMLAALHGERRAAERLIARGAQVNRPGWAPLHYAAAGGDPGLVRLLLEHHAYIDAGSPNGTTPLMMAAREKHLTAMRALLEEGADPTLRNERGWSAADYLDRQGEPAQAAWMREQARAFERRQGAAAGTGAPPAPSPSPAPSPAPASPAPSAPAASPALTRPLPTAPVPLPAPAPAPTPLPGMR